MPDFFSSASSHRSLNGDAIAHGYLGGETSPFCKPQESSSGNNRWELVAFEFGPSAKLTLPKPSRMPLVHIDSWMT